MSSTNHPSPAFRFLLIIVLLLMAAGLGYVLLLFPPVAPGLSVQVASNLELSGVENPVTAVLLNYRAYDTLLELGVLLLALIAVWSLGTSVSKRKETTPGVVLDTLSAALVPLLILIAGYLLWIGAIAPGGAFQAGAVLAAAGVLLILTGWQLNEKINGFLLRFMLVMGLGVFMLVGLVLVLFGRQFLEYPPSLAAALILLIEAAATLSIGITLVALFSAGNASNGQSESEDS